MTTEKKTCSLMYTIIYFCIFHNKFLRTRGRKKKVYERLMQKYVKRIHRMSRCKIVPDMYEAYDCFDIYSLYKFTKGEYFRAFKKKKIKKSSNKMSYIAIAKNVQTCKVNVGAADRMFSQRFENKQDMLCPKFNGFDNAGRQVCADSFVTKTAGCNSAESRIKVENEVERPHYSDFVTLNITGLTGPLYGSTNMHTSSMKQQQYGIYNSGKVAGHFGGQNGKRQGACTLKPEASAMAQIAASKRNAAAARRGAKSENFRRLSGW